MSRIGAKPVSIPKGVTVKTDGSSVAVEGPKGKMKLALLKPIQVKVSATEVVLARPDDTIRNKTLHGTMRSHIQNMVTGVSEGFAKKLLIEGVGFRAALAGKKITLALGFTHPIELIVPEGLTIKIPVPTEIQLEGSDPQQVGYFAAKIRSFYEPEPYKGKGVRYSDEVVRRKAGKSVSK